MFCFLTKPIIFFLKGLKIITENKTINKDIVKIIALTFPDKNFPVVLIMLPVGKRLSSFIVEVVGFMLVVEVENTEIVDVVEVDNNVIEVEEVVVVVVNIVRPLTGTVAVVCWMQSSEQDIYVSLLLHTSSPQYSLFSKLVL